MRLLIVGNPLDMHPENFFPEQFGKAFALSKTLRSLEWLKDRRSILAHADHGMVMGSQLRQGTTRQMAKALGERATALGSSGSRSVRKGGRPAG